MQNKVQNRQQKLAMIAGWQQSGLSQKQYCLEQNIPYHVFYYWYRQSRDKAAERGEFSIGGRIPVNPSGGLESKGHPIGATGLGQIYELVTQLRGEAGARQVDRARVAIAQNGGGIVGVEEAVVAVTILGG